jgi:hypothetical protein
MHESGSFLLTVLDRIRAMVDEPSAKYTDQYIVNHVIMPEMTNVLSRLENSNDAIILNELVYTPSVTTKFIQLPPNVGEVHRMNVVDDAGRVVRDYSPREMWNRSGPGWHLEGNTIRFRPSGARVAGETITLWYKAEGDFMPHYALDGRLVEVNDEVSRLELSSSPTLGQVDRRANSYIGAYLRLLPESPGVIEERIISEHHPEASTPYVDVRLPFEHARDVLGGSESWSGSESSAEELGSVRYEIAPVASQALYQATAACGAMQLAETKDVNQRKMRWMQTCYLRALKTAGDRLATMNQRKPKHFKRHTADNPEGRLWFVNS